MGRSPASFQKRQRELARRERQQMKAERRAQRKTEAESGKPEESVEVVQEVQEAEGEPAPS